MYVSKAQLEETYRSLETAVIRDKLDAGELTPEAAAVGRAELAARARDGEPVPSGPIARQQGAARRSPGASALRKVMKVVFVLYLLMCGICVLVMFADPPWQAMTRGGWTGAFGLLAAFAMGLPWSLLLARAAASLPFAGHFLQTGNFGYYLAFCALLNPLLFWLYFSRSRD